MRITKEEYISLVLEKCAIRDYEYLGFVSKWSSGTTKLNLKCKICNNKWSSTNILSLLHGHGCPNCGNISRKKSKTLSNDHHIDKFKKVSNNKNLHSFVRIDETRWSYCCKKCSNDVYVDKGLCSGVFVAHYSNILAGKLSCRCAETFRWTKEQKVFQIENLIIGTGYSFCGWQGSHKYYGKMLMKCPIKDHDIWLTDFHRFLKNPQCPKCSKSGFKTNKPSALYVIKVVGELAFTGYGISNNVSRRLKTHKTRLLKLESQIVNIEIFYGTGEEIVNIEQKLKEKFPIVPQPIDGFKTEATHLWLYDDVVGFADKQSVCDH